MTILNYLNIILREQGDTIIVAEFSNRDEGTSSEFIKDMTF